MNKFSTTLHWFVCVVLAISETESVHILIINKSSIIDAQLLCLLGAISSELSISIIELEVASANSVTMCFEKLCSDN